MSRQKRWVFECRAPLEAFATRLGEVLEEEGFSVGEGELFDVVAKDGGDRLFVALRYDHRGIEATAKVKTGLTSDDDPVLTRAFEALRRTQVSLADRSDQDRRDEPDDRAAKRRTGGVAGPERDEPEQDADHHER